MYKTFEELERLAYMSNLPKIAKLYAQLDDYYQNNSENLEKRVKALENKLGKIEDIIND